MHIFSIYENDVQEKQHGYFSNYTLFSSIRVHPTNTKSSSLRIPVVVLLSNQSEIIFKMEWCVINFFDAAEGCVCSFMLLYICECLFLRILLVL